MAVLTIDDAPTPTRAHHLSRIRVLVVAAIVALSVAVVGAAATVQPDERILEVGTGATSTGADTGAAGAIESWLADHRHQLFAGAEGDYVGSCTEQAVGLCSTMTDDLGDAQVHTVGVAASDWGADVLVERAPDGGAWQVTAVAAWPALGDRYDGAPWSPTTAITTWWLEDDRARTMYGDEAAGVAQLETTLVEDAGTTRTYDTGLQGRPADVRITVERQPDRTWAVVETLAR